MLCTDSSCGGLWLYEERVQYTGNYYCFCNTITVSVTTVTLDNIVQESPVKREVTRWSSHSEAMLQASLDDVDWDMFRASSADVSEFTDVALSFVYMLTDQATETVTIRTFSNQKPWVDRTIRAAVNQRTAAYNAGLLSGNMSEYKASCYALRRAVRAAKLRYRERIESHFQLNDSRRMWQGLKTICSSGNNSSAEVRADPLLAEELNTFYGRFDRNGGATLPISAPGSSRQSSDDDHVITVSEDEVRRELRRVNIRKAAGPDGITGRVLRSCADQLAGLFTSIFNESLATSVIPTSFKKSVIIPVPKNSKPSCLNDYRPVALTSTVMKVFERLLKKHICSSIPATLDPLQFAYRPNRSTDDAISQVLHSSLTHIDSKNGNYVRLLFIDYSSAFNTIVPSKLAVKLSDLGPKHYTLWLDPRLPHRQTTSGENGPVHLQLHHPERRSPAGLRSESPALLSLHTRLCVLSQLHFYC